MDQPAYSYRDDPAVPPFPDDAPLLIFDGVCHWCSGFAQFVLRHDRSGTIRLTTAQSPVAAALMTHYGLDPVEFETNLLLAEGRVLVKSDAFIEVMRRCGWPWKGALALRIIPRGVRDRLYDPIARNRYRLAGKRGQCMVPAPDVAHRFL